MHALIERGVIGDFRAPDFIRVGLIPLGVGFEGRAVDVLRDMLSTGAWRAEPFQTCSRVT